MSEEKVIRYKTDEVEVIWRPDRCIHSKLCWQGLPQVFRPRERPWVDVEGASADAIRMQVRKCPSGALGLAEDEA